MPVPVVDPFDVAADPEMPFLAGALDPHAMRAHFERRLPRLIGDAGRLELSAIRVTRHRPAWRCLIEYDVTIERPGLPPEQLVLIGKVRAWGLDKSTYRLVAALWNAGFDAGSQDGISVPEPVGTVPEMAMWLQRKVPGTVASQPLAEPGGEELARRIAEAAHKIHRAGAPPHRRHSIARELRILHDRLLLVARIEPRWERRLQRLLDACDRLGAFLPASAARGIHRDFYPDQVIVSGSRLFLLDFDMYTEGDPAVDIGNFVGHITEQSLRTRGDAGALRGVETALVDRFLALSGGVARATVQGYATLTLARHVYISTRFPERRPFTERILELCERRLDIAGRGAATSHATVGPEDCEPRPARSTGPVAERSAAGL